MEWRDISLRWEHSVVQIIATRANFNLSRPYLIPNDEVTWGTGFILDVEKGIVVTHSDNVRDAVSIFGKISKLGKRNIGLKLLSICQEKHLAICKIDSNDLVMVAAGLVDITDMNMILGDNMKITAIDSIMMICYGENESTIRFKTGIVTGFKPGKQKLDINVNGKIEDAYERGPSHFQTDILYNNGFNGSPIINKNGEVIGIYDNGDAIGTRTLLSIYNEMLTTPRVKLPSFSLEWNNTTRDLLNYHCGSSSIYGIYVRDIGLDSCLSKLNNKDIITHISYQDPFWASDENFNIINANSSIKTITVTAYLDRFGDAVLSRNNSELNDEVLDSNPKDPNTGLLYRKISLPEIVDMIPIGSKMTLQICRDRQWYKLEATHVHVPTDRINYWYLTPNKIPNHIDYMIFSGLCCTQLYSNHQNYFPHLHSVIHNSELKYKQYVLITQIFPNTSISKAELFSNGNIIKQINGININTLDDIREILLQHPSYLLIETVNKSVFFVLTSTIINEDKDIINNLCLNNYQYLLS